MLGAPSTAYVRLLALAISVRYAGASELTIEFWCGAAAGRAASGVAQEIAFW